MLQLHQFVVNSIYDWQKTKILLYIFCFSLLWMNFFSYLARKLIFFPFFYFLLSETPVFYFIPNVLKDVLLNHVVQWSKKMLCLKFKLKCFLLLSFRVYFVLERHENIKSRPNQHYGNLKWRNSINETNTSITSYTFWKKKSSAWFCPIKIIL